MSHRPHELQILDISLHFYFTSSLSVSSKEVYTNKFVYTQIDYRLKSTPSSKQCQKRSQKEVEIPFDSVCQLKASLSQIKLGVKLPAHRVGLPGDVDTIAGSALTPVLEFVSALPAYLLMGAYRQAGKVGHPADLPVNWGILIQNWARMAINKSDFVISLEEIS